MNNDNNIHDTKTPRNIWVRGLVMILMALAYQLVSTLLFFVAIIQFLLVAINNEPNIRLAGFGRSLGRYQSQVADFVSFVTEVAPFPFSDFPS